MGIEPQPQKPTVTAFMRGADGQVLAPGKTDPAGSTLCMEFTLPPIPAEVAKDPDALKVFKDAFVTRVREVVCAANSLHLAKGGGGLLINSIVTKIPKPPQQE